MKRALVIGANSMLGQSLVTALAADGNEVIRCVRSGKGDISYDLASLALPPEKDLGRVDVIFQCAAGFGSDAWDDCIANTLINTAGSWRIAQWAERLSCPHVVMAGSIWSCTEAAPSSYGLSKAQGEDVMQFCCSRLGVKFSALRLPQLCDDWGLCARHQIWFARIVARAAVGDELRLPPGDIPRNFLHVQDAARALFTMWNTDLCGNHILVAPKAQTYREIAEIAYATFGKGGSIVDALEMKPFRPMQFPCSTTEAAELLGDKYISIGDTIARIHNLATAPNFTA